MAPARRAVLPAMASLLLLVGARAGAAVPGTGFEVDRYAVALRPDLTTTAVSGTETVVVRSTSAGLSQLSFSGNALRISEATVDGAPIAVSASDGTIVFRLPRMLGRGQRVTLRFRYEGTPARGVTATADGLYTSYFACDWMVCLQDAPGDKAHFALDLFLPAGVGSEATARRTGITTAAGLHRHRWRSRRPYSPYLYAFAAGRLPRRSIATPVGRLDLIDATGTGVDLERLFAEAPAVAAFLADKAGMPLPDRRYAQLLVPGRAAQEAAGLSLIGLEELERERDDPASAWIIAHEMAHQWWGNLVTVVTWRDFWLHEGIATFMVAAWKEHLAGPAAYRQELDVARARLERAREIGFDKPLSWAGSYPSLGARRAVQYSKGALFLAHLRASIGDAAFWSGLRRFTRRHAGGTVTSRDFQVAMERASGRDLAPTFVEWVYGDQQAALAAASPHH